MAGVPTRMAVAVVAALTALPMVAGCRLPTDSFPSGSAWNRQGSDEPSPTVGPEGIRLAPESHRDSYARAAFGARWSDVDRNGCDTRNDVLARDLRRVRFRAGSTCVVTSGLLTDPYTGTEVRFSKSGANSVDIDHVVPLADAWRSGAWAWDPDRRRRFANDPDNLLATSARVNREKADHDPGDWLPANRARACRHVRRVLEVKAKWGLSADRDEIAGIRGVLEHC